MGQRINLDILTLVFVIVSRRLALFGVPHANYRFRGKVNVEDLGTVGPGRSVGERPVTPRSEVA